MIQRIRTLRCIRALASLVTVFVMTTVWAAPVSGAQPRAGVTAKPGASAAAGTELTGDEGGLLPHNTCKKQPSKAKFRITLPKETELEHLINWMMTISCQKFIWDRSVRSRKVTILSPVPVTLREAYAAFYASLETMGLTVEPSGDYFKIVETKGANQRNVPLYGPESRAPSNDRFVTQLYRVSGGDAKSVGDVLKKLASPSGTIETVNDLLIITDRGSTVRRLIRVAGEIDSPLASGEKIFFYQLRYADVGLIAGAVRDVFGETSKGKSKKGKGAKTDSGEEPSFSRVIEDERTNTLIIVAHQRDYDVIRRLISKLDVDTGGANSRIHVVKLKHADPEEVAKVLSQLASGAKSTAKGRGKKGKAPAPSNAQMELSGDVKVTPDPATRSLVILASQSDFNSLRQVIEALDTERKQVFIEVYLLELTVSRENQGGASAHFGIPYDINVNGQQGQGLGFIGSTPQADMSSLTLGPSALNGLAAGIMGPEVPGSGQFLGLGRDIPAFGVQIQALQANSDVNVVSSPTLYTADNQEATIEIGRNVPTPGGISNIGGAGGSVLPLQNIEHRDVTLKLQITPHINDEDTVTLELDVLNRDIAERDPVLGVTTTKRQIKQNIVAHDDQPVVLGGLVQDIERETVRQVPGLGSIPLLGWLFKRKVKQREKVNLVMYLVPHILETPDDLRRVHERIMRDRREFLETQTAFRHRDLDAHVDYGRKAGLLASVNAEAARMDAEVQALQDAVEIMGAEVTGEIGLSPAREEDDDDPGRPVDAKAVTYNPTIPAASKKTPLVK